MSRNEPCPCELPSGRDMYCRPPTKLVELMFPQMSVILFRERVSKSNGHPGMSRGVSTSGCMSRGYPRFQIPTLSPSPIPKVLTPSGGHQNMYTWQADGTHPTGMLSYFVVCRENNRVRVKIINPIDIVGPFLLLATD